MKITCQSIALSSSDVHKSSLHWDWILVRTGFVSKKNNPCNRIESIRSCAKPVRRVLEVQRSSFPWVNVTLPFNLHTKYHSIACFYFWYWAPWETGFLETTWTCSLEWNCMLVALTMRKCMINGTLQRTEDSKSTALI